MHFDPSWRFGSKAHLGMNFTAIRQYVELDGISYASAEYPGASHHSYISTASGLILH